MKTRSKLEISLSQYPPGTQVRVKHTIYHDHGPEHFYRDGTVTGSEQDCYLILFPNHSGVSVRVYPSRNEITRLP